jgi:hypothetical protein
MSKRKYIKRSDYWNKFESRKNEDISSLINVKDCAPASAGEPYYVETSASCLSRSGKAKESSYSRGPNAESRNGARFANIRGGLLPYVYGVDGINVRDSIELCQKAYANIAVFRNAIDVMSEFANSDIYLEGGSASARDFVYKWFEKINLWNLKDQYFREYYRSGNIFLYRIDGKFSKKDFDKMNKIYASDLALKPGRIPVKYILLNPYDIVAKKGSSFQTSVYEKILSEYDLERLRNPKTEYDEQVLKSLDEDIQSKIKNGQYNSDGLSIKLDPGFLVYSFYKKQDYEPFAVPFGYPVLDDINFKMELKKIDQAICRTIENVILLITMGAEPDKGGLNPKNMEAMQNLFKNESVGRVLVSDYTTKANFVIPDISKVVGPNKYEVVNNDIKEGLQNVIVGDERYSNTQVKAKIFLERLEESRNAFMNDFLQPQVKMICKNLGFRKYPTVKFQQTDIKDEVQLQRVATRLMELGIITPEQGMDVLEKGFYPKADELVPAQTKYVEQRRDGLFNPIVGGVPMIAPEVNETEQVVKNEVGRPVGTSGIPQENKNTSTALYSVKSIQDVVYTTEAIKKEGYKKMRAKLSKKSLSKQEKSMIDELAASIVVSCEKDSWAQKMFECIDNPELLSELNTIPEILDRAQEHELDDYSAALLYHSDKDAK